MKKTGLETTYIRMLLLKKRLCCADVVVIEPFFGHQSLFIFISESDAVDGNPVLIWF